MTPCNLPPIFRTNGYPTPQYIKYDTNGKLHRFGKKKQYWYICFDDWIVIDDWTGQLPKVSQAIDQNRYNSLSYSQKLDLKHTAQESAKKANEEKQKDYEKTALQAQELWSSLSREGNSVYLKNKALKPVKGIRFGSDNLGNFITTAIIDNFNKIWTLQKIYDKPLHHGGNKMFLKCGRTKGNYSLFGNIKSALIYICEGVATALSVLLAIPESLVVTAYSCHNFDLVAKNIKTRFKDAKIYIIADNDSIKSEVQNG